MRYAIQYTRSFRHYDTVDEVIFDYAEGRDVDQLASLVREDQTAIIDLSDIDPEKYDEVKPILVRLKQTLPADLKVKIPFETRNMHNLMFWLQEREISYIFSNFAICRDQFYSMCLEAPSDIYVAEALAFDLENLFAMKQKYNVRVRVFPDIAQTARFTKAMVPAITSFFIRPEDTEVYEPYVDVFELVHNGDRLSVVYEVYKQRQWLGRLDELIDSFSDEITNRGIAPHFGQMRLNCQKRCMVEKCNVCMNIAELVSAFNQVGIEVIKKKYKEPISEQEKEELLKKIKRKENEVESEADKEAVWTPETAN